MSTTGKISLEKPSAELISMDQDFFPAPWSSSQWMDLDLNRHLLYNWRVDGQLLGFALFGVMDGDDTAHLYKILVHPEKRGAGVAGAFWSVIIEDLRSKGKTQVYLEVEEGNKTAISFYLKEGFQLLRKNKAYYSDGSTALIMSLTL